MTSPIDSAALSSANVTASSSDQIVLWGVNDDASCRCPKGFDCPLKNRGKHPKCAPYEPGDNLGNLTGAEHGRVVVDVDVRNGDGFAELAAIPGIDAPWTTRTIATASGGAHFYFRHPGPGFHVGNGKLSPHVDVRGDKAEESGWAYVVAPGSRIVKEDGSVGTHEQRGHDTEAPCPDWLIAALLSRKPSAKGEAVAPIDESHADWTYRLDLFTADCTNAAPARCDGASAKLMALARRGAKVYRLPLDTAADIMQAHWSARCTQADGVTPYPWSDEELLRALENAACHDDGAREIFSRATVKGFEELFARHSKAANDDGEPEDGFEFGGLDGEEEPVEYLVAEYVPAASVVMLAGEPGVLKTWTALDIARAVAQGKPWLGKHATKKGVALVVDYEMGRAKVRRRMRLLRDDGSVGRWSHPDHDLNDPRLWEIIRKRDPALVVFDSLSGGNPEAEEKDPRFALPLKRAAKFANDTGCTFVFIHHTTKDGSASKKNRIRGTGAILAALDVCYLFEPTGKPACSSVECIKMREGEEPASFVVQLTDARGLELYQENATALALRTDTPQALDNAIRLIMRTHGGIVPNAVARLLNKRPPTVRAAMAIMKESGEVVVIKKKWHLDDDAGRKARVVAALDANHHISTLKQLGQLSHVDIETLRELEQQQVIWKTSATESGAYVSEGTS